MNSLQQEYQNTVRMSMAKNAPQQTNNDYQIPRPATNDYQIPRSSKLDDMEQRKFSNNFTATPRCSNTEPLIELSSPSLLPEAAGGGYTNQNADIENVQDPHRTSDLLFLNNEEPPVGYLRMSPVMHK
jgi:hypothetical protein